MPTVPRPSHYTRNEMIILVESHPEVVSGSVLPWTIFCRSRVIHIPNKDTVWCRCSFSFVEVKVGRERAPHNAFRLSDDQNYNEIPSPASFLGCQVTSSIVYTFLLRPKLLSDCYFSPLQSLLIIILPI